MKIGIQCKDIYLSMFYKLLHYTENKIVTTHFEHRRTIDIRGTSKTFVRLIFSGKQIFPMVQVNTVIKDSNAICYYNSVGSKRIRPLTKFKNYNISTWFASKYILWLWQPLTSDLNVLCFLIQNPTPSINFTTLRITRQSPAKYT